MREEERTMENQTESTAENWPPPAQSPFAGEYEENEISHENEVERASIRERGVCRVDVKSARGINSGK